MKSNTYVILGMIALSLFGMVLSVLLIVKYGPKEQIETLSGDSKVGGTELVSKPMSKNVETYFAKMNEKGIIETIIVADQEFINSGVVGDPAMWVLTDYSVPEKAAIIGGKYSTKSSSFITKDSVQKYGNIVEKTDIVEYPAEISIATTTP